jgi:hypothetical protein
LSIILFGWLNMTLGAKINAEMAFLAKFFLDLDVSLHVTSPKQFNIFDSITFGGCYLAHNVQNVKYF